MSRGLNFLYILRYFSRELKFNKTQSCLPSIHITENMNDAFCYIYYMLLTQRNGELCVNDKEV